MFLNKVRRKRILHAGIHMKKIAANKQTLVTTLSFSVQLLQLVLVFSNLNIISAQNCPAGQTAQTINTYAEPQQYMICYSAYKDFYAVDDTYGYNEKTDAGCRNACNHPTQENGNICAGYNFDGNRFGSQVCQLCLKNEYTPEPPIYSVPQYTTSYVYLVTGETTICVACESGKFKATTGSAACTDCPANTDSPAQSDHVTDCTCVAPFSGPAGGPCSCAAGSAVITRQIYDDVGISGRSCERILDTIQPATLEQCQLACDTWTPNDEWGESTCDAFAYHATWQTCRLCFDRSERSASGYTFYLTTTWPVVTTYTDCALCPVNTYSTDGTSCENCPANTYSESIGSTSSTTCVCGVGFTGTATCTQCVNGKYKSLIGSAACSNCNSGYVSNDDYSDCNACDAGKYEENDECLSCAAINVNLYSAAGSTVCLCNAGSSGPDDGPCQLCAVGKYKNIAGSSSCIECEFGQVALTTGRTSCQNCAAGKYYASSTSCTDCYEHSTSPSGAQTINDCFCVANYYKSSSSTCSTCPAFSTSPAESDDVSDCLCNVGYEFLSTCEQCLAGYYKPRAGNFWCDFCVAGKYSDHSAATECLNCAAGKYSSQNEASICTDCPDFSISVAGSVAIDDCKCNAGYSGYSQNCLACDFGKYKSTSGSQACTNCPASKTSTSEANVDESSCICDVGFGLNQDQNCVACEAGKYKSAQDNSVCLECPIAKYQDQSQQSSCDDCTPDSTTETTGKTSALHCLCNSGYTSTDSGCSLCVDGLFKDVVGNEPCAECENGHDSASNRQYCIPCKANQYLFDDGDQIHNCINCPTNSKSDEASEGVLACLCDAGYGRVSDFECEACALGFTKSSAGNEICVQCAAGTYINYLASTACLPCQDYSYSTEASSRCNCNAGYVEDSVDGSIACIPCAVGKIATESSLTVCEDCAVGKYNAEQAATICIQCPENSVTLQSAGVSESECLCNAGYTRDTSGVCVACAANSYKSTVSDKDCTNCPENTFSEEGTVSMLDCGCNAGYAEKNVMNVSICEACEAGKYKVHVGSGECLNCQVGKYSLETGKTSANDCIACPLNSVTLLHGSASIQKCICNAGFVKFNSSNISSDFHCVACEIGKYSEMFFAVCKDCLGNTTTLLIGTNSKDKCLCNTGYAFNSDLDSAFDSATNEKCVSCEPGKYKSVVADSQCLNCGIGKYSNEIAQTNESNCKQCFDNSQTVSDGATSSEACLCNAGYTYVSQQINSSVFARCEPCAANTFKAQVGNAVCDSCAFNAFSEVGSIRCTCNDGFYVPGISATLPDGLDCVVNPYMHYIFSSSGHLDDQNSCKIQCEDGYYRTSNRNGLKCRAHTHSPTHECAENHFLILGTYYADAECRACKTCVGKQILHECNRSHDTVCVDCVEDKSIGFLLQDTGFLPAFARFVNAHGSPCKLGCLNGLILNKVTKQCEVCLGLCKPGYFFPENRQNCTHCEKCATVLPMNAQYVTSEDRVDCEWTCVHGFQLEHGECIKTIHSSLSGIETTLSSEFDDASICTGDCHEPGCIIHNGKCISCFELPGDHPIIKTLSTPENELKKKFANSNPLLVDSKPPYGKHRWVFTSSCTWQCLIGWRKIRSDDLSHFKCEAQSTVNHLLRATNQKNNFATTAIEINVQQDVIIMSPSPAAQNNSQKNVTIISANDDSVLVFGLLLLGLPILLIIILAATKLILLCLNK